MNQKSKGEKLFILTAIAISMFIFLCFAGCSSSCFGCTVGCESNEGGCVSGIANTSEGCGSKDSCKSTFSCIDWNAPYDDGQGDVLLLSCEGTEDSCSGENGCYHGTFCGGYGACGTCGTFCGSIEGGSEEELHFGCVDGCFACGDSDGIWSYFLERIYDTLGLN